MPHLSVQTKRGSKYTSRRRNVQLNTYLVAGIVFIHEALTTAKKRQCQHGVEAHFLVCCHR